MTLQSLLIFWAGWFEAVWTHSWTAWNQHFLGDFSAPPLEKAWISFFHSVGLFATFPVEIPDWACREIWSGEMRRGINSNIQPLRISICTTVDFEGKGSSNKDIGVACLLNSPLYKATGLCSLNPSEEVGENFSAWEQGLLLFCSQVLLQPNMQIPQPLDPLGFRKCIDRAFALAESKLALSLDSPFLFRGIQMPVEATSEDPLDIFLFVSCAQQAL